MMLSVAHDTNLVEEYMAGTLSENLSGIAYDKGMKVIKKLINVIVEVPIILLLLCCDRNHPI